MALGENAVDAGSFTAVRLISGVLMLMLLCQVTANDACRDNPAEDAAKGSWRAAFLLFIYAVCFSFAYNTLDTGTGALILFTAVQMTILFSSYISGQKIEALEWAGVAMAFAGFIYLVAPALSTPSLVGLVLMSVSGVAWGLYTLAGKGSGNPLGDTRFNFMRTLPLVVLLVAVTYTSAEWSLQGVVLAVLAGSITSGVGYAIWYMALAEISPLQAAVVQLLVPALAALGGTVFADDVITMRLIIASIIILLGILVVILGKPYRDKIFPRVTDQ